MLNVRVVINNGSGRSEIKEFAAVLPRRVSSGLYKAGLVIEREAKQLLSGPSHTKNPGNGNPFPGVVTGTLRRSVTTKAEATRATIGPGGIAEKYAAIHEFGGFAGLNRSAQIPARPYMSVSLTNKQEKAFDAMWLEITRK